MYLQHGLLAASDTFLLGETYEKNLPFLLFEEGYDVWIGNNRGNKYSTTHKHYSTNSSEYWDFSLDEFAKYDIPDSIEFILNETGFNRISYIGFSQGSAQGLASLSLNQQLQDKINIFIGLSPALIPNNLNGIFNKIPLESILVKFFGSLKLSPKDIMIKEKQHMLQLASIHLDLVNFFMFGCYGLNVSTRQKIIGYSHLFCSTSTKTVIHWLNIIKNRQFTDHLSKTVYPISNIKNKIIFIYGDNDLLVDLKIPKQLFNNNSQVEYHCIKSYEHMDTLWGNDVNQKVFQPILNKLKQI